jgi:CBS domain containing-hemolysin-like protein
MTATAMKGFLILLLIPVNGVVAMAEITVLSARKMRLQYGVEKGDAGERAALWSQSCTALPSHRSGKG